MIELTRQQLLVLRSTIRQALGLTGSRRATCCVTFKTTSEELLISAQHGQIAMTWCVPGQYQPGCFALPMEALATCEGRQQDVVRIERSGEVATLRWHDAGIPQSAEYALVEPAVIPEAGAEFSDVGHEFLAAMAEASATTESGSLRYALSYIRLRGSDGQIAATDSRQALLQYGFQLPWEDTVLVPATDAFNARVIRRAAAVSLARTEGWVFLRADAWTIALQIEKERRFPDIDAQLPEVSAAQTTLILTESDAGYFVCAASRLPGADDSCSPLTLDLNGAVVVRAKAEDQPAATELRLSNSHKQGDELQVSSDRAYLKRAVELGFREIHLRDAVAPAFCRSDRRAYLWALLGKDAVLKRGENATRIESPMAERATPAMSRELPADPVMPAASTLLSANPISVRAAPSAATEPTLESAQPQAKSLPVLIAEGEALRATLREVLVKTRALVAGLRQQHRHSDAKRPRRTSQRTLAVSEC